MVTENFQAKALAFDIRFEHQHAIGDLHHEAFRNLSTFDFVGIVEYFPESILALSDALGCDVTVKRLNVTSERSSAAAVGADDLTLIRELNAVDSPSTRLQEQGSNTRYGRNCARVALQRPAHAPERRASGPMVAEPLST